MVSGLDPRQRKAHLQQRDDGPQAEAPLPDEPGHGDLPPSGPEGLGGWLAIAGVVLGAATLMAAASIGFAVYWWVSGDRLGGSADIARMHIGVDAVRLPLGLAALALFWRKSRWFPRAFIAWAMIDLADSAVRPLMLLRTGEIGTAAALTVIALWLSFWYVPWVAYILRSQRVRNTFARR